MPVQLKYPPEKGNDSALLHLREDYAQAVLDLFDEGLEAQEVRPNLRVVGHTSNFLDNMRLPIHRWFRYSAGFSAEWVKWSLAGRKTVIRKGGKGVYFRCVGICICIYQSHEAISNCPNH